VYGSARLNQSLSRYQSMVPVHAIPRGVWSPQVLFAPLPPHSDLQLVRFYASSVCINKKHSLTPIMVISHPLSASFIYYDPWHPPCSIYMPDSLFPQSLSKFSLVYLLGLAPSTSYSICFFPQSSSSFRSTCPCHHCSTEIISSNPSLSLNPLLGTIICAQCCNILACLGGLSQCVLNHNSL